jgi:hypothetical protein
MGPSTGEEGSAYGYQQQGMMGMQTTRTSMANGGNQTTAVKVR